MNTLLYTSLTLILAAALMAGSFLSRHPRAFEVDDASTITQVTHVVHHHPPKAVHHPVKAELHLCRSTHASYSCEGTAYDQFTDNMMTYVLAKNSSVWGRREFPIPANSAILVMGNSHTRQVCSTLRCQFATKLDSTKEHEDLYHQGKNIPSTWHFANNSTLTVVTNTALVYHKDKWVQSLEPTLERPLSSFDAIVMGRFNGFDSSSNFGKGLISFSKDYPELFDASFSTPNMERLAAAYSGPCIALPMFAVYGQDPKTTALQTKEQTGRTNIYVVDARKHIDNLGQECGSDLQTEVGVCLNSVADNPGGRDPSNMHRCTGKNGGHVDLVAWDLVEQLHEILA